MFASAPPPPTRAARQDRGPALVRAGTALGAGAAAALACVVPAAMRVSAAGGEAPSTARAWLALAAVALVPMVAAIVVLRGASEGLRAFAGPGAGLRALGVGLWLASLLVVLAIFGTVLRANTHHHGLAGVTFAFGALFVAVFDALVCARLVSIARALPDGSRRVLLALLSIAVATLLFAVGYRFVRAAAHDSASYAAAGTVVDVLAFVLAAVFASRRGLARRVGIALFGPPVAVAIAIVGLALLHDGTVRDALGDRAPAYAEIVYAVTGK